MTPASPCTQHGFHCRPRGRRIRRCQAGAGAGHGSADARAPAAASERTQARPHCHDPVGRQRCQHAAGRRRIHAGAAPAAKGARGGPLQLDPQQLEAPAAATPARPLTPPAPRLASAPTGGGAGGYVVQVSSQKSEAEARSVVPRHADEVSERVQRPFADHPARRSRRQGRLLSRAGWAVRHRPATPGISAAASRPPADSA